MSPTSYYDILTVQLIIILLESTTKENI